MVLVVKLEAGKSVKTLMHLHTKKKKKFLGIPHRPLLLAIGFGEKASENCLPGPWLRYDDSLHNGLQSAKEAWRWGWLSIIKLRA